MNADIEEQLVAGMHDHVDGVQLTTDVLGAATRSHQRRVAVRRTSYAAGVVGLAGVLAAAVMVTAAGPSALQTSPPPAVTAEAASLQLAAAVAASEKVSYKVKYTVGTKADPDYFGTAEGAYDSATSTGYLTFWQADEPAARFYERLINGKLYLGSNRTKTWTQEQSDGRFRWGSELARTAGASADPEGLFEALQDAKATITQTSASTYHFERVTLYDAQDASGTVTLAGDVTLNADKRIVKVAYELTDKGQYKPVVQKINEHRGVTFDRSKVMLLELSDYGTPVRVEKPTDVVAAR
jgi:hypothetical protein